MIKHYILHIEQDIQPFLKGPFKSPKHQLAAARWIRHYDPGLRDGIHRLDINISEKWVKNAVKPVVSS